MQVFQVEMQSAYHRDMAFTPDGRFLAVAAQEFTLLDTAGGRPRLFPELGDMLCGFAFIRDGTELVYRVLFGSVEVFQLSNRKKRRLSFLNADPWAVGADPSTDAVFVSVYNFRSSKSEIRLLRTANMKRRVSFAPVNDYIERLIVSADGRWLAGQATNNTLRVWRVDGPELPSRASLCVKTRLPPNDIALSRDGTRFASVNTSGLDIWSIPSGEHLHFGSHRRAVTTVAFSPTQPVLVTGDNGGKVFLWDYTGRVLTRYNWGLAHVCGLCFAPDGLRCAAVDAKGKVVVWDVDV